MKQHSVLPGAASFYYQAGSSAVLLCHGFSGTPQSVQEVAAALFEHGYSVYAPLLSGHGTHFTDLEHVTAADWKQDVEKAYEWLASRHERIFIMGQSMGGTLASYLASSAEKAAGMILINAAMEVPCLAEMAEASTSSFIAEGEPDIHDTSQQEIAYLHLPVHAIRELVGLTREVEPVLSSISIPALLFKSAVDHVVPPENTTKIYQSIRSEDKTSITLPNSYHVATMDYDKHIIIDQTASFMNRISALDQPVLGKGHE
ncbi:carboxylesterase [Sinobaca sp. H24]|uniref:alpha/beta hydrolase n=1 Tax=Sinobaca sp. H24 TaxID=2923376 RepID=UPI00207B012E|nr:alpha/beta fold hydrolase [Sinobaca sp. H24]